MGRALTAGVAYFGAVFAAGVILGTLRTLLLVPALGEVPAVVIEIPVMLTISWVVSRWLVRRFAVSARLPERVTMGVAALVLLLLAEAALAILVFQRPFQAHLTHYTTLPGALGLAAQVCFAAMPVLRLR
ncbi:MAG: hypothetical protein WCD16_11605 [Paracoccaceae bacterium]